MISGAWGKKIGMTQVFQNDKVVPVTVIDIGFWRITGGKTKENDGYDAIQIGLLRDRYVAQEFSSEWLKELKKHFRYVREIKVKDSSLIDPAKVGEVIPFEEILNVGDVVDVFGKTKGCGFAGVVRRHNFRGSPASHGSTMGKKTGSLSFMRSQGRVIKGKRMPGHMGVRQRVMKNLEVVGMEPTFVLVKGSVPGKAGTLLFIRKMKIS